jgi:hypothetical protein
MTDDQALKLFRLAVEYFQHNINEDTAEDPEEWKWEQEAKFDRLYEEVERLLGFPSFAESQQELMKKDVDYEAHMKERLSRHATTAKVTSEIMASVTKSIIQEADLPIDKKAKLLAGNDGAFEDGLLSAELKTAKFWHENRKEMESKGLL